MVRENIAAKSIKFILRDLVLDILLWPIWWYGVGLKTAFGKMGETISQGNRELALSVWVKNLFKPMFGQYDWQGRIISFFMRVFQIIFRFLLFMFWIIFSAVVFLIWFLLPIFLISQILLNLGLFDKLI